MRESCRQCGFTVIELLVVIGIISLLAVALLPQLVGAGEEGRRTETAVRLQTLKTAIDGYERRHGRYPPDDFVDLAGEVVATPDAINSGIESLVIFLHQQAGGQTLVDHRDWLRNWDQDDNAEVIPLLGSRAKLEVVDAWGVPLAYFTAATGGFERRQKIRDDFGEQEVRAWRDPEGGGYLGGTRYQLVSAGPDNEFNTDDDLTVPALARRR